jgi:uncharacterized protein (TIGR02145 family)
VKLTDLSKLYPMFASGYDVAENTRHTGLMVYNVNQCPAGRTIYDEAGPQAWNGNRWQSLKPRPPVAEADPAAPSGADIWGTGVVRHKAKPGIYEEFYSADFGPAGRWMTTNLAAWKYDGINHSQDPGGNAANGAGTPRTMTGPNANSGRPYNAAYWCYPNGGNGGSNATSYTADPHLGLLYTWDAATAGKGGDDGIGNIYNTSGGGRANNEQNMEETLIPTESGKQLRIQGICPQGWHLPSDYEWLLLEKEIYENAWKYSAYTQDDVQNFPNGGIWDDSWSTSGGFRPSGSPDAHGKAMKGVCGVTSSSINPDGLSNSLAQGGFSVLMAGMAGLGITDRFGLISHFWTSSANEEPNGKYWYLDPNQAGCYRQNNNRYYLFSIRCKKD